MCGMLGAIDRSYTTRGRRGEHQFDAWREIVAEAFVPVQVDTDAAHADDGFAAECEVRRVGDLTVSWLSSSPQRVERTSALTTSVPCGVYFLNLPLDSPSAAQQDGRTAVIGAGDFVVLDGDRPFRLDFPAGFEQISLTVPKAALERSLIDASSLTAVTIPGGSGVGAVAAAAFMGLALHAGRVGGRTADAIAEHVVGLLAAALDSRSPEPQTRRVSLYRALLEQIETHHRDPDLTLHAVTRSIAISPSYATQLFADNGTTFGRRLLACRLDSAWRQLPGAPWGRSITDIAIDCGFRDPAHFARAFRARFGMTPSERRFGAGERR